MNYFLEHYVTLDCGLIFRVSISVRNLFGLICEFAQLPTNFTECDDASCWFSIYKFMYYTDDVIFEQQTLERTSLLYWKLSNRDIGQPLALYRWAGLLSGHAYWVLPCKSLSFILVLMIWFLHLKGPSLVLCFSSCRSKPLFSILTTFTPPPPNHT